MYLGDLHQQIDDYMNCICIVVLRLLDHFSLSAMICNKSIFLPYYQKIAKITINQIIICTFSLPFYNWSIFEPRPMTAHYLQYREQAEANKPKVADQLSVGDFIYSYQKSSKYHNLMDMLKEHLTFNENITEYLALVKLWQLWR